MDITDILGTILMIAGTIIMLVIVDMILYHVIHPYACFFAVGLEFVAFGRLLTDE